MHNAIIVFAVTVKQGCESRGTDVSNKNVHGKV